MKSPSTHGFLVRLMAVAQSILSKIWTEILLWGRGS